MLRKCVLVLTACGFIAGAATPAYVTFHLIQIEQVIGGVNGDVTAQAIQLRMRAPGQCFVSQSKLWVRDAAGLNPVLLIDLADVAGCASGDRVLIASPNFTGLLDNAIQPDFTLTNLIPESYLAAGTMTFEDDLGNTVYWRLSWGGKSYTGDTSGSMFNDADGDYGPPYDGPLPADGLQALQFQGSATAQSMNNQEDYALTKGASTWTNNADESGTLVESNTTPPNAFNAFRGFLDSGTLDDVLASDDADLCHDLGITIFPSEAPITLDFDGTLPTDSPSSLEVTFESSANTPGLELTILMWNYNTNSWKSIGTATQGFNTDVIRTFVATPADHVEAGTGNVRTRYEVRQAGIIFTFPWTDCIDQVFWTHN